MDRKPVHIPPINSQRGFAGLYQQYASAMFNVCLRMTGDYFLSKDILQDSFLIAFEKSDSLRDQNRVGGWLKRIVVNECIRALKKTRYWADIEEMLDLAADEEDEFVWWEDIAAGRINEEVKLLPAGCRQVFVLFAIENFSHKEVANLLDISESTSKTQYKRAKALLKERLLKKLQYGQV